MFNILGSLFFGYGNNAKQDGQPEQGLDELPQYGPLEQHQVLVNTNESNSITSNTTNMHNPPTTSTNPQKTSSNNEDQQNSWVIVDRTEFDTNKLNKSINESATLSLINDQIQQQQPQLDQIQPITTTKTDMSQSSMGSSCMLGSFFEKNENEDEEFNKRYAKFNKSTTIITQKDVEKLTNSKLFSNNNVMSQSSKKNDWCVTPVPALTNLDKIQRSTLKLDSADPMENLLIEHPSMSVFIASTSTSSQQQPQEEEENDVVMKEEPEVKQEEVKKTPSKSIAKVIAEKRKEMEANGPQTNLHILKKKGKKNRKSPVTSANTLNALQANQINPQNPTQTSASPNNKENLQVKCLLGNDFKKFGPNSSKSDLTLLNKNQMKRSNKNLLFTSIKQNSNFKQRKYHKLQQPSFTVNVSNGRL